MGFLTKIIVQITELRITMVLATPVFTLSHLGQKPAHVEHNSLLTLDLESKCCHRFPVGPVDGLAVGLHPSPGPPRLCQEPQDGWTGPTEEDKSQTEELLRALRKCFITFKKDCQGFSQGTHDPRFISSLFSIISPFFSP